MELTGFPFWRLNYDDDFKIAGSLSEAQDFVRQHEVSSISFYVNVMCTQPGVGGTEKTFGKREMTKEELLSLTPQWLAGEMRKAGKEANEYFFPQT
jgi:hypothetical protein